MRVVKNTSMQKGVMSFGMKSILFLQIDLEGHSLWFRNAQSKPAAVDARAQFAESLKKVLWKKHSFRRLYWFGDGGMFFCDVAGLSNFDCTIDVADTVFQIFSDWKAKEENRAILQLRISIHYGSPVYTHKEYGYWTSDDLNVFSKYERKIALPGTIAITDKVRPHLLSENIQTRFPKDTEREVLLGRSSVTDALIRYVYYDASLQPPTYPSTYSLFSFLNGLSMEVGLVSNKLVGPASAIRLVFGEAILLYGVGSPSESLRVYLKRCDLPSSYKLTPKELNEVNTKANVIKEGSRKRGLEDKQKVSPERIVFPLSDFPCFTIEYHPEFWSIARAFQKLLEENQSDKSMWSRLAKNAADTQISGIKYPGILCMHILVHTAPTETGERFVLLCQRNKRGPEGFFHEGKWSCSIEEQVNVGETIERCVQRGISEELLGPQASEHLEVKVVSAFLERVLLNLTLLAVVDIPMSYEDIVERWMRDAIDKNEHRQLVALPLREDLVVKCLKSGQLDPSARGACLVSDKQTFRNTTKWDLHPTSPLRLATALWFKSLDGK